MQQKIKNARDAYIDCVKMNTWGTGVVQPRNGIHNQSSIETRTTSRLKATFAHVRSSKQGLKKNTDRLGTLDVGSLYGNMLATSESMK